jgi:hypothetical protein
MAKKIIVGLRGWVHIGEDGGEVDGKQVLTNAFCIRRWGTPGKGLGQLAREGKQDGTVLDAAGTVRIPVTNIVHSYDVTSTNW